MDSSKATTVVLCCTVLFCSGISGSCDINRTAFTADCSGQNLDKVPSYVPDSIEVLNLRINYFKEVNPRQFRRFYNLVELDLSYNMIIHLNNDSDTELSTLRVLDISGNRRLQDLNSAFFASIPNLQKLFIIGNDLEVSMFKGLRNLTYLDMSFNQPISVNSTPFMELEYLEDLNLNNCGLKNLSDAIFTGLSNLLMLNLGYNDLDYLPSGVFVGLTKLKVLDLSYNRLYHSTSLPTDIFQPLIHLEQLRLFMNDIPHNVNYTYVDNPISKIPSLKQLYITGAPNTNFGHGYSSLKNLEYLKILGNLSEINNETFFNLRYTRTLALSLGSCKFSYISRNAFTSLINLTSLDVSSNMYLCKYTMWRNFTAAICNSRIKNLIATNLCTFDLMSLFVCSPPYLEYLDMSLNNLRGIPYVHKSLKELILTNNNIEDISSVFLSRMYNLEKLDLSDQTPHSTYTNAHLKKDIKRTTRDSTGQYQLYTVASVPLYNTTTINKYLNKTAQNVEFKDGNLTFKDQVRNMTFNDQARNMTFNDQARNMTFNDQGRNMTLKSEGLSSETRFTIQSRQKIPAFLEWIDVSRSRLICELYKLDITNNYIRSLNISRFRPNTYYSCKWLKGFWPWLDKLTHLETLDLSGNQITEIPAVAFTHTIHLKHLNLAENYLVTLTFEMKSLVNLTEIYLSNNLIQYASNQFTTGLKSNDLTVYIDGNNLLCDCSRLNFVYWLCTSNVIFNITGLMCKYKNETQVSLRPRAAIYQLLRDECIYVTVTVSCVIAFIVLLIGGSVVAILLHKRWKEQYLSVFGRRSVNPYHPLEECQIELEYDIYISYERDHDISAYKSMHGFVTKELYPWLKQKGFKVLIRDELHAGRKLYSEISEALRKTRNVVVLLSNDYCADFWNVFEFNVAAMEGIYTKRQVIIPITFEILKPELFHEEINAFLKSGPLPRYTPNTKFSVLADFLLEQLASLGNL